MIGLVVITHASLGREFISAAQLILGTLEQAVWLSVDSQSDPDTLRKQLKKAVQETDSGQGVLILTDMFGGTPNNISLTFLEENRVEVVTGVNLPMVIKAATTRQDKSLAELASLVCREGRGAIAVAGELLSS